MYTKSDILEQLKSMNAPQGGVVLMHTSLRAVGDLEGGAKTLLDAMIEYFTADGGLFCVPTHTWDNLGHDVPTLDMTKGESNLGAFSVLAVNDGRGIRSENPTHSMVVFGEKARAEAFVAGEERVTTPTAPDSCYGKLCEMGGHVLLVGVDQCKNTYLHCVAEMLGLPNRMASTTTPASVKRRTGEVIEREFYLFEVDYTEDISHRFAKYDSAFRYHGCTVQGQVGDAPTQLCDARGMKRVVELIFARSGGVDPLVSEEPIPPKWYCGK